MKMIFRFILVILLFVNFSWDAAAIDPRLYHPNGEGEAAQASPQEVQKFIKDQIIAEQRNKGFFTVMDPRINRTRRLYALVFNVGVREEQFTVDGKEKTYYYTSTIFRDVDYGEQLKVNVYAEVDENGNLKIVDRQIAKEGGRRR